MNRRNVTRALIALIGGVSTTIGQCLLLYILFPVFMIVHGLWVMLGLLCFNCGAAGLILFFYQ